MASFYSFLSEEPKGKTVVRLCNAVVERMKGVDEVAKAFEKAVGVPFGCTSEDGSISLDYTACIGLSDQAPGALINNVPVTNIKPSDVPRMVEALRGGAKASSLPQAEVDLNLRQPGPVVFAPMERGGGCPQGGQHGRPTVSSRRSTRLAYAAVAAPVSPPR